MGKRVTLIRDGEYYWVRDIETNEVFIGQCLLTGQRQGAMIKVLGHGTIRHHQWYVVLSHIPYPQDIYPESELEEEWME